MDLIFTLLLGTVLGGGLAAWILSKRWLGKARQAELNLQDISKQHTETSQANRELKQKVADLQYQLNQAQNELRSRG